MNTAKTIQFISESEALFIAELQDRLDVTDEDKDNGYIQDLFAADPDYIRFAKCEGRGQTPFIAVTENEVTYIITPAEIESDEEEIVNWWLEGAKNQINIENNWQDWQNVNQGIAYRGGSGYCYALYAKN